MHTEILSDRQQELLSFISQFKRSFYLVGGTAIALHIGHRQSIDFDLFTQSKINIQKNSTSTPYYTPEMLNDDTREVIPQVTELIISLLNVMNGEMSR